MKVKKTAARAIAKKGPSVGARIIEGLEEAIAWSKGENTAVRVTQVQVLDGQTRLSSASNSTLINKRP